MILCCLILNLESVLVSVEGVCITKIICIHLTIKAIMFNTKSTTLLLLLVLATATAAAGAETTTGCKAGVFQVERTTNESDYCISCPEVEDGRKGTPKIAVCTPRPSNVEVISSNDIIVSGVGGTTTIITNRKLMESSSLEVVQVDDVTCNGDTIAPIGVKCFYGNNYARNIDPNITDTEGREYSVEYVNSKITTTSDAVIGSIMHIHILLILCLGYLFTM